MIKKKTFSHFIAQNITKTFGQGSKRQVVLDDISLTCRQGQSYAITGVSGSGKSTLLHILGGLEAPTSGKVECDGRNIFKCHEQSRSVFLNSTVGFVFQFHYLINELTVLENIMLPGRIAGKGLSECRERAIFLLSELGLAEKAASHPYELSGGQQQRVSIMRALFNKPSFILADEPTGNLDAYTAQEVLDLFMTCHKEWGLGLIVSSHDPSVFNSMNTIYTLQDGSLFLAKR